MSIVHLNQALSECSPDQRAYLALELAREEQKRQQREQFWERLEVGVTTGLVGLTLLTLLNSKLNQASTTWYQTLASGAESEAVAVQVETLPDEGAIASADLSNIDTEEPRLNEAIGQFVITSGWGERNVPGGSQFHMGLDLAAADGATTGKPVFAIGAPGETIEVKCWHESLGGQTVSFSSPSLGYGFDYLHLDSCIAGTEGTTTVKAGDKVGTMGNSGSATTGAHLHMQQRKDGTSDPKTGTHEPVARTFAEMAVGVK